MKPPRGLLGAALGFWGWQSDLLIAAVPVAIAVEVAALIDFRFDFDDADFRRIGDLCLWMGAAVTGYAVLSTGLPHAVVRVVELAPLAALPLVLAQSWSTSDDLDLLAIIRLGDSDATQENVSRVHAGHPFLVLCLLGAAAANGRSPWFYASAALLGAWALWGVRSRRYSALSWIGLLALVTGMGFAGHLGLTRLQQVIIASALEWISGTLTDPYRSTTAIGEIGAIKLSDRIVLRLEAPDPIKPGLLLHRATYDSYANGTWLARGAKLVTRTAQAPGTAWLLHEGPAPERRLVAFGQLKRGKGVLALPPGTGRLSGLAVDELRSNAYGTVRVEKAAPVVSYTAHYRSGGSIAAAPTGNDLKVPAGESKLLAKLVRDLGLKGHSAGEIASALSDYFARRFTYTLYQARRGSGPTPIADFLTRTRAGHCEYFASATVLLLRAAGVPARYATGYSVQEWSTLEQAYIIRLRHAHAWARYFQDGTWHDLDTTPGVWPEAERQAQTSFMEPVADLLSWLRFRLNRWRAGSSDERMSPWWFLLLVPLVVYVAWRLRLNRRRRVASRSSAAAEHRAPHRGHDSPFYRVESSLRKLGSPRRSDEPLSIWLERLATTVSDPEAAAKLDAMLRLHYQYRFDPDPFPEDGHRALCKLADEWLAHLPAPHRKA